jgi:hypothetical protein
LKKGDSLSNSPFPFLDVLSICNIQYNLMSWCYKMNEYSIHFTATFLFIQCKKAFFFSKIKLSKVQYFKMPFVIFLNLLFLSY